MVNFLQAANGNMNAVLSAVHIAKPLTRAGRNPPSRQLLAGSQYQCSTWCNTCSRNAHPCWPSSCWKSCQWSTSCRQSKSGCQWKISASSPALRCSQARHHLGTALYSSPACPMAYSTQHQLVSTMPLLSPSKVLHMPQLSVEDLHRRTCSKYS